MATKKSPHKGAKRAASVPIEFTEKLASSGLSLEDAKSLDITYLDGIETWNLIPSHNTHSIRIGYLDVDGKPVGDVPSSPQYYRLRYLDEVYTQDGDKKKLLRYIQPANTLPMVYVPHVGDVNWVQVAENPSIPLIITEGELKAAKATKEGFPTIGLGGVWSFKSKKIPFSWIPSLDQFKWLRRNVYLCWDSDWHDNADVRAALIAFCTELWARGALPYFVQLDTFEHWANDNGEPHKVGLDDFFVQAKTDPIKRLSEILHEAQPYTLTGELAKLNSQFVHVVGIGVVQKNIVEADGQQRILSTREFKDDLGHLPSSAVLTFGKEGEVKLEPQPTAKIWLNWPLHTRAERMALDPTQEPSGVFVDSAGLSCFNTFTGWGCEPIKGDVKPFLELVDQVFKLEPAEAKTWFLRWLAYPLQHPGTKMYSSVLIYSPTQGNGKSYIGEVMRRIYGDAHSRAPKAGELMSDYNGSLSRALFILGDEIVMMHERRSEADKLKALITQRHMHINPKFGKQYIMKDQVNYYLTSNRVNALFLDDSDRRFLIVENPLGNLSNDHPELLKKILAWCNPQSDNPGKGPSALFHHLLHLELGDFDPTKAPPYTLAKSDMIDSNKSDLEMWAKTLKTNPDEVLVCGKVKLKGDIYSGTYLQSLFMGTHENYKNLTAAGFGSALKTAGLLKLPPFRTKDKSAVRAYVVRNHEKWSKASATQIREHFEKLGQ